MKSEHNNFWIWIWIMFTTDCFLKASSFRLQWRLAGQSTKVSLDTLTCLSSLGKWKCVKHSEKKEEKGPFSCPQNRPLCGTILAPLCDMEPFHKKEEPFSEMAPLRHHFGSTFFLSVENAKSSMDLQSLCPFNNYLNYLWECTFRYHGIFWTFLCRRLHEHVQNVQLSLLVVICL